MTEGLKKPMGIIFCDNCGSSMVDSGTKSPSTLHCFECGNSEKFRVGKLEPRTPAEIETLDNLFDQAWKDAFRYPPSKDKNKRP